MKNSLKNVKLKIEIGINLFLLWVSFMLSFRKEEILDHLGSILGISLMIVIWLLLLVRWKCFWIRIRIMCHGMLCYIWLGILIMVGGLRMIGIGSVCYLSLKSIIIRIFLTLKNMNYQHLKYILCLNMVLKNHILNTSLNYQTSKILKYLVWTKTPT